MHGPCGSANPTAGCMKDGKCQFGYPKAFTEQTTESDDNSYPIYRQRNNGRTFQKGADGFVYDNCSVAPHNPWLSMVVDVISMLKSAVISQQLSTSTKDVTELLFPLGFMRLNLLLQRLGMKLRSLGNKEDILELQRHRGVY